MADHKVLIFNKGIHNVLPDEKIPTEALQDERNWLNQDGVLRLVNGKVIVGDEGAAGKARGLHKGYKAAGTAIFFRKISTKIQYWDGSAWQDTVVGLTDGKEYNFANYTSLAGQFVFASGYDGLYKINTANPASYCSMYVKQTITGATGNDKGKMLIDKGRMIMWDMEDSPKTVLKFSWIDKQNADVHTAVAGEATASLTGTLAFKAVGATRNCFFVAITITGSGEIYSDNKDGTLAGNAGGTGTINYISGVYTLTNPGVGTAAYYWEDSNAKGVTDFSFNTTARVTGTGNYITQEIGGDKIQSVKVGQDGAYYSLKKHSAYKLDFSINTTTNDELFNNLVYRTDIGIPTFGAAISTERGIVFMNTANPDNPQLTILQRNILAEVEPLVLFPHFDFSNYSYDDCFIDTWGRYIIISCQSADNDFNDTILLCDIAAGIVDIGYYPARMFMKDAGNLYAGSPITDSVYNVFDGFDDDNFVIENYAILRGETYGVENLKKYRILKIQGQIQKDQTVEIWHSYDDSDFELIGSIDGHGAYVDSGSPRVVGSNMAGIIPIGGDNAATVYPYFYKLKISTPKFRKKEIKFVATGMGYVDINSIIDDQILLYENRIPSRYRVKKT